MKYFIGLIVGIIFSSVLLWFAHLTMLADLTTQQSITMLESNIALRDAIKGKYYKESIHATELIIKYELEHLEEDTGRMFFPETKEKLSYWLNQRSKVLSELSTIESAK